MLKKVLLFFILIIGFKSMLPAESLIEQGLLDNLRQNSTAGQCTTFLNIDNLPFDDPSEINIPDIDQDQLTIQQKLDLFKEYVIFLIKDDFKNANTHLTTHQKEYAWGTLTTVGIVIGGYLIYKYFTKPSPQPAGPSS